MKLMIGMILIAGAAMAQTVMTVEVKERKAEKAFTIFNTTDYNWACTSTPSRGEPRRIVCVRKERVRRPFVGPIQVTRTDGAGSVDNSLVP